MKRIKTLLIIFVVSIIIVAVIAYFDIKKNTELQFDHPPFVDDLVDGIIFVQDKEVAKEKDCGVTVKKIVKLPKTSGAMEFSLAILFNSELSRYGKYDSLTVQDGVAKVMLRSSTTPSGAPLSSLSSCEVQHLTSVLKDTLTQYPGISTVQLYSPEGKVEF